MRKQNRANDLEVQARRQLYESGEMARPEIRPTAMTEGSKRWRKMKQMEAENLRAKQEVQQERDEMQRLERERLAGYQPKT